MEAGPSTRGATRPPVKRGFRWWWIIVAVFLGLAVSASVAIYVARKPVAAFLVQAYLLRYGASSVIEFDQLSRGGFAARVRVGPDTPDFAAEIADVTLDYHGWFALPTVGTVRLVKPVLRASFNGEKLNFGSLQRLVDEALAQPPEPPGPTVTIEDGKLFLSTPEGPLQITLNAEIDQGRLNRLNASLAPAKLKSATITADIAGGTLTASTVMDAVNANASVKIVAISVAGDIPIEGHGIDAAADIKGLTWLKPDRLTDFAVANGMLRVNAQTAAVKRAPGFDGRRIETSAEFRRLEWHKPEENTVFEVADLVLLVRSEDTNVQDVSARRSDTRVALEALRGNYAKAQMQAESRLRVETALTDIKADGLAARSVSLRAASDRSEFRMQESDWTLAGPVQIAFDGNDVRYSFDNRDIPVRSLQAGFAGSANLGKDRAEGALQGSLTARANLPRPVALDLVRNLPIIGADPEASAALIEALRDVRVQLPKLGVAHSKGTTSIVLSAPATVQGSSAALTIQPQPARPLVRIAAKEMEGGFALRLRGEKTPTLDLIVPNFRRREERGGTILNAALQFDTQLNLSAFRRVHLSGTGQVEGRNTRTSLALTRCADFEMDAFMGRDSTLVADAKGKLCAEPARTFLVADNAGWRLTGTWTDVSARLPQAQSTIGSARGRLDVSGNASGPSEARVTVDQALVSDQEPGPRFRPISLSGTMNLANNQWQGILGLTARNRRFASVAVKHDVNTAAGAAAIDAGELSFDPMFQPSDILPFLSTLATRVRGRAPFTGTVAWNDRGFESSGRVRLRDIDFQSRFGAVQGTTGDLAFSSLLPVTMAPHQAISINRVDWLVPIEQAKVQFSMTPTELQLELAAANVSGGQGSLDPLALPLTPSATTKGTLRLKNIDLTPLLTAAGLGERVKVTARIAGTIPFTSGPEGLRFMNGKVAAETPGRLSIQRQALDAAVGLQGENPAAPAAPPTAVQDFAYQALENLSFDQLTGDVDSRPMGRLGVLLHLKGRHDPPQAMEARVPLVDLLQGRAFDKPLPLPKGTPIDLTLDTSLNLDELLASYFGTGANATASAP